MTDLPWRPLGTGVAASQADVAVSFEEREPTPCVLAIGMFDGLHRGHQSLLAAARDDARVHELPCVVLTFDPDPSEVVGAAGPSSRLLVTADRVAGLQKMGADEVLVLSFTPELSQLEPEAFVCDVLLAHLRPVSIHVGSNFRFGRGGVGTPQVLAMLGERYGFDVRAHGLLSVGDGVVSATRIRSLLAQGGRLDEANELLGRCHYVRGHVEHGRGEGTSFGFPTANVVCDVRDCMPAEGVYACYVCCGDRSWPAAVNVGAPPTFSASKPAFLEANLVGFSGDLYDADVAVSFVHWLRPSRVFDSLDELERVVLDNIDWVRTHL